MTMSTLLEVPGEIILGIAERLDIASLRNLMYTSKVG